MDRRICHYPQDTMSSFVQDLRGEVGYFQRDEVTKQTRRKEGGQAEMLDVDYVT